MNDFEKELRCTFLDEAKDLIAGTEKCFLSLEAAKTDPTILESIFRLAHNLKGSAKAVGFTSLSEFTHKLESFLLILDLEQLVGRHRSASNHQQPYQTKEAV